MSKPIRIAILANGRQAKSELKSVAKETTALGKVGGLAGKTLKAGLLTGVAGVAALAGTALAKGFGRLTAIDQAKSQLRGLRLEAKEVESVMGSANKAVTGTAYGLDSAATAAAGALGAGVSQGKELTKYLTQVADATSQSTTDFNSMALMMNKVEGAGKLTGTVLNQMAMNGLQVMPMLTKEYGVNAAEMQKMVSRGEVSSKDFRRILEENIGGAAQKSGETFRGSLANMQAALGRLGAKVLEGAFSKMPALFSKAGKALDRLGPIAEKAGSAIGKGVERASDRVESAIGKIAKSAEGMFKPGAMSKQRAQLDTLATAAGNLWDGTKKLARSTTDLLRSMKPAAIKTFNTALDGTVKAADLAGKAFSNVLVPGLSGTAGIIGKIPGPIKEIGLQAGIAALVLPRLTAATDAMGRSFNTAQISARVLFAEFRDGTTRSAMLRSGLAQVGGMARNVAGVGGMVALTQAAGTSNKALSTLGNIGGGAMLGFAVGGPVGAAIGGTAGGLLSMWQNSKKADDGLNTLKISGDDLKSTMDGLTGATGAATRQLVLHELEKSNVLKSTRALGLADREVVSGIVGQGKARQKLTAVLADEKVAAEGRVAAAEAEIRAAKDLVIAAAQDPMKDASAAKEEADARIKKAEATKAESKARLDNIAAINSELGTVEKAKKSKRAEIRTTIEFSGAIKKLPKAARFDLRTNGIVPATKDLAAFANQHKLTPKELNALIKATGAETTVGKVEKVRAKLKETGEVRTNMGPYVGSVKGGIDSAAGVASSQSGVVGTNLASGAASGVRQAAWQIADEARNMVSNAIRAANGAMKAKSPSRLTMRSGRWFSEGLAIGIRQGGRSAIKEANKLVSSLVKASGASGIKSSVKSAIDEQAKANKKAYDREAKASKKAFYQKNKSQKARRKFDKKQAQDAKAFSKEQNKASKKANKATRSNVKSLIANSKALKKVQAELTTAKNRLEELTAARQSHINAVKSSFVELGNISNFEEGHLNNPGSMLQQLRERVKIGERFASAVNRLRGMKLNDTSIQQLLDKGPEAGLAAAEALAAGGAATIAEVNSLTSKLAAQGRNLGTVTANQFHNAGIQAAKGLVNGLKSQEKALIKQATRLARQITRAIRKALKIKSPSRETMGDGVNTGLGLVLGIGRTENQVRRAGVTVAEALQGGLNDRRLVAPLNPTEVYTSTKAFDKGPILRAEITLTAEQVDQLTRGRRIQADLDAWSSSGGRIRS